MSKYLDPHTAAALQGFFAQYRDMRYKNNLELYKDNPELAEKIGTDISYGGKYAKIIETRNGQNASVLLFVALETFETKNLGQVKQGDILKAASWQAPAKHARGNIFDENPLQGVKQHGAKYLK